MTSCRWTWDGFGLCRELKKFMEEEMHNYWFVEMPLGMGRLFEPTKSTRQKSSRIILKTKYVFPPIFIVGKKHARDLIQLWLIIFKSIMAHTGGITRRSNFLSNMNFFKNCPDCDKSTWINFVIESKLRKMKTMKQNHRFFLKWNY